MMLEAPPAQLLVWQLHSWKQTQFDLQRCVRGLSCPVGSLWVSWLCFGCGLCAPPAAWSMSGGSHPFHFMALSGNKGMWTDERSSILVAVVTGKWAGLMALWANKFCLFLSCPAVSGGGLVSGWDWHVEINNKWPITHTRQHYWNVLALTWKIRRCLKQHRTDLLLKVVSSAVAQASTKPCVSECLRPLSRFFFTLGIRAHSWWLWKFLYYFYDCYNYESITSP